MRCCDVTKHTAGRPARGTRTYFARPCLPQAQPTAGSPPAQSGTSTDNSSCTDSFSHDMATRAVAAPACQRPATHPPRRGPTPPAASELCSVSESSSVLSDLRKERRARAPAPYATTLASARPGGSTIGCATSRALPAPYSCSTSASANSNDVPGPRLVGEQAVHHHARLRLAAPAARSALSELLAPAAHRLLHASPAALCSPSRPELRATIQDTQLLR